MLVSMVDFSQQQQPTAERRVAQGGNGTFFQPLINGINTFFNPSQFRNGLNQFSVNRNPNRLQPQQFSNQQFPVQQQPAQQQFTPFQNLQNNPTFQQDFRLTRFPQGGSVTSEQQFQFVPRQQQQTVPANRFIPGFAPQPSARPFTLDPRDNVPTVPAVTNFEKFRPGEATQSRFSPSPRPFSVFNTDQNSQGGQAGIFPPRLSVEQVTFSNSRTPEVRLPGFPDTTTSLSVEPVSVSGILNRIPGVISADQDVEDTGNAFRGQSRLQSRGNTFDPSGGRGRGRNKVKLENEDQDYLSETETELPITSSRGRVRSRFNTGVTGTRTTGSRAQGTRTRVSTGSRASPTGKRRRQRLGARGEQEIDVEEDIENNKLPEEERRSESSFGGNRRKVNRISGQFTSRRKNTKPTVFTPGASGTRVPVRKRIHPALLSSVNEDETNLNTESPGIIIDEEDLRSQRFELSTSQNGISVLPISLATGAEYDITTTPPTAPPTKATENKFQVLSGFKLSPEIPIIQDDVSNILPPGFKIPVKEKSFFPNNSTFHTNNYNYNYNNKDNNNNY